MEEKLKVKKLSAFDFFFHMHASSKCLKVKKYFVSILVEAFSTCIHVKNLAWKFLNGSKNLLSVLKLF